MIPSIDFRKIRTHRGSQHGAFEELSVQLFRATYGAPFEVTRVEGAGGDGGVEAFYANATGTEGIQAKFFSKLGASQWRQIENSITAAKKAHRDLRRYIVTTPLDRNPANVRRWNQLAGVWRRKHLKLVWWGYSELIDLLSHADHHGRVQFWFGAQEFSEGWLDAKNACATRDLDSRYTPQRHVRVESEDVLRAFGRFEGFIEGHAQAVAKLREEQRWCERALSEQKGSDKVCKLGKAWATQWRKGQAVLGDIKSTPNVSGSVTFVRESQDQMRTIWSLLRDLHREKTYSEEEPYRGEYMNSEFSETMSRCYGFLKKAKAALDYWAPFRCTDASNLLVLGEAGSGKSHLVASFVKDARSTGQIALLGLGEHFRDSRAPLEQWTSHLGWSGTVRDFLGVLNSAAEATGKPAILCIDALNESPNRELWRTSLGALATQLKEFAWIRLLVSCRSDFARITLPAAIQERREAAWGQSTHEGFGSQLFAAVISYFEGYHISSEHFPPLLPEFENPLFLKTVCEAYENETFPAGPLSLSGVMDRRVQKAAQKLLRDIDCPESMTRAAIRLVASELGKCGGPDIESDVLRPKIEALFPGRGESQSLYRHLVSNGVLVEVGSYSSDAVHVRFPYERFSEYFVAEELVFGAGSVADLRNKWQANGVFDRITADSVQWIDRGLIWALSILLPERFKIELVEFVGDKAQSAHHLTLLETLPWRSAGSFNPNAQALVEEAERYVDHWDHLLRTATVPGHPFNVDYLHRRLIGLPVAERDRAWTVFISESLHNGESPMARQIVSWARRVPVETVSDEQALLATTLLCWFFSSNSRGLRHEATLACIRVVAGRAHIAAELVHRFLRVNDPYVAERVYCVAAGAAMRETRMDRLQTLADAVFQSVFNRAEVSAHVLLRDYARNVLEVALYRRSLPAGVAPEHFRPPYRSTFPTIWSEAEATACEESAGWEQIKESVQPEERRHYGDFGRYVMGSALFHFTSVPLNQAPPADASKRGYSHMTGRRWILQRVKELGWTPESFKEYEERLQSGRMRSDEEEVKLERISKKYQWIALRELEGYLSDHFHVTSGWNDELETFLGNWTIGAREFDPSQPQRIREHEDNPYDHNNRTRRWWEELCPPLFPNETPAARRKWVATPESRDISKMLHVSGRSELPGDWLTLVGYFDWAEKIPTGAEIMGRGKLTLYTFVRSWLIPQRDLEDFLTQAQGVDYFGNGIELRKLREEWLGEYPWAPSVDWLKQADKPRRSHWLKTIMVPVVHTGCEYEVQEHLHAYLPSRPILRMLQGEWDKQSFRFIHNGEMVAVTATNEALAKGPLFVRTDRLTRELKKRRLALVWTICGERDSWDGNTRATGNMARFSGVYHWTGKSVKGAITFEEVKDW